MVHQKLTREFQTWVQKFQEISKAYVINIILVFHFSSSYSSAQKERNTPVPSPQTQSTNPQAPQSRQTWGKQQQSDPQQYHQYVMLIPFYTFHIYVSLDTKILSMRSKVY